MKEKNMEDDWIKVATEMFYKYRKEADPDENVKELALINAGKAVALLELLEKFGARPKIK